jgi:DNA-binding NtrC family response regulator
MASAIKPIVLVVDPDALTLLGLSATLHQQQLEVHGARTRRAALSAANSLALDLVLIDGWIEDDGGLELLGALRAAPHLVDLPVIFFWEDRTSHGPLPPAAFCLVKPLDLESLQDLIKRGLWLPHLAAPVQSVRQPHFQGVHADHSDQSNSAIAATSGSPNPLRVLGSLGVW